MSSSHVVFPNWVVHYLITKTLHRNVIHSLEMGVERVDDGQRDLQQIFDDEAERNIVREPNLISDGNEPSVARQRHHFYR